LWLKGQSRWLSLLGRVVEFHNDLKLGKWNRSIEDEDMWTTLQNKTCGIIGYGSIGSNIAKFLKAYGCRVIGFKKHAGNYNDNNADEISSDLSYVLNKSEIVFVCLPSTSETKGILSEKLLMNMKGKYLINVGRGDTVNEEGLFNSLINGILAGAALDVWYNYPGKKTEPVFPASKAFWELPNVVLSPHKSSHTIEAINAMINDTFENIRTYLLTGTPGGIVSF